MRILVAIGMLIVFISVFFILLTGKGIADNAFSCIPIDGGYNCTYTGVGPEEVMGFVIIFFFILVDVVTVYMIIMSLRVSNRSMTGGI